MRIMKSIIKWFKQLFKKDKEKWHETDMVHLTPLKAPKTTYKGHNNILQETKGAFGYQGYRKKGRRIVYK